MKGFKWLVLLAAFWLGVYAFIIIDRDRSMWVLNTALQTVSDREQHSNVRYGEAPWQQLDIYPAAQRTDAKPVIVFIHGGGWYHGRKDQYYFAADALARYGYVVVIPDYTKYPEPEARFPAHLQDMAKAVAWTRAHISNYGGDPDAMFLAGHSAGAHTAVLLASDNQYLRAQGMNTAELRGVAALAGPYRFTPDTEASIAVFAPSSNYPRMNPLAFIDGDEPPMIVLHSDIDESIANHHPRELQQSLQAVDVPVELLIYEDRSHADMVTHLHPWFADDNNLMADIDRFFQQQLR